MLILEVSNKVGEEFANHFDAIGFSKTLREEFFYLSTGNLTESIKGFNN
jgi:hypothetical protein